MQIPNVTCSGLSVRCLFSVQAKLCQWFGNASATCLRQFLEIDVPVQSTLDPEWAPVKGCETHRIGKSFLRSFGGTGSPCFYVVSSERQPLEMLPQDTEVGFCQTSIKMRSGRRDVWLQSVEA